MRSDDASSAANPRAAGRSSANPGYLEPSTQHFIEALAVSGTTPFDTLSTAEARGMLARAQAGPVGKPPARVEDTSFPIGPKGSVAVRIVRPSRPNGALPAVVYFHGGGWILGGVHTHDRLIRELANGVDAALVFVDYSCSPESRFPTALEEAYAATRYVAEHAAVLGVDESRLAIAGDNAGGNLAAAVSLLAKERRGPRIDFQLLFYPITDARFDTESYRCFANGPWLTRRAMEWFWDAYLPDRSARRQILATPLNASIDQLRGLPEALVIVAENDVLRDEGEAYARRLSEAGVRVTSTRYSGTIHDFVMLNAIADSPATRAAIDQAIAALRVALA